MGLFNKKEEVPEIPTAQGLPELPTATPAPTKPVKKDLPELPSFPATSQNETMNQEMVKSAVADMPSPGEEEVHVEIPEGLHVTEEQGGPAIPPKPSVTETGIPELPKTSSTADTPQKTPELNPTVPTVPTPKSAEPIFVRIDKFQAAQKNFESIKDKVKEIESVLAKIKGVKSKEEEELKGWTEDVEKIKSRLAEVDAGIFNQI